MMHADIMAVAKSLCDSASFWPTSGRSGAFARWNRAVQSPKIKKRTAAEQHSPARRRTGALRRIAAMIGTTCTIMVDRSSRYGQHGHDRQRGKEWHQQKHGTLRDRPPDGTRRRRDCDVTGMIECRVAPHAARQLAFDIKPQRQGCHGWAKHVANDGHYRVRDHHRPEDRQCVNGDRAEREHNECQNDQAALGPAGIDRGTDRRLHCQTNQPASHSDQADTRLAPVSLGDQEHVQVWPERAPHIRKQEVQCIE